MVNKLKITAAQSIFQIQKGQTGSSALVSNLVSYLAALSVLAAALVLAVLFFALPLYWVQPVPVLFFMISHRVQRTLGLWLTELGTVRTSS